MKMCYVCVLLNLDDLGSTMIKWLFIPYCVFLEEMFKNNDFYCFLYENELCVFF